VKPAKDTVRPEECTGKSGVIDPQNWSDGAMMWPCEVMDVEGNRDNFPSSILHTVFILLSFPERESFHRVAAVQASHSHKEKCKMRKVTTFLCAALVLGTILSASAQQAPDMFKDMDPNHWAYQATESLRAKNIVWGYPDGWFRGRRTLTRYEFAVALDRALKTIMAKQGEKGADGATGAPGAPGAPGADGAAGPQGPSGVAPEDLEKIKKLAAEFKDELTTLGNNIGAVNRRLDALTKDVADIKATLSKMPTVYGKAFIGIRADRANGPYTDYNGAFFPVNSGPGSLNNTALVTHEFLLGVKGKLNGGGTYDAGLVTGNYVNAFNLNATGFVNTNPGSDTYLHHLEINTPFGGFGKASNLTLGRFGVKLGNLTLYRPDVDRYLYNDIEDNGAYTLDGVKLKTNFGSVNADIIAGQTRSYQGTAGFALNSPMAGAAPTAAGIFNFGGFKPIGLANTTGLTIDQIIAVKLGMNIGLLGNDTKLNFTALDGSATNSGNKGVGGISNVLVLGSGLSSKLSEKVSLDADWAKSITGVGRFQSVGVTDNNAFNANLGFGLAGLDVKAGYRYIDPLFYAPGYWGRIGNWINPTNVQGPTVRANYNLSSSLGLNFGGDFYKAAKNRDTTGGLGKDDEINRALLGVRWDVAKNFHTTLDWEGVYWKLNGAHGGAFATGTGTVHPTEQYLTLGTGYNLTSNTALKMSYQIGDYNGHGVLNGGTGNQFNNNTFTTSLNVKF